MTSLLRLTACLLALIFVTGCEAEFSVGGPGGDMDDLVDGLVAELVGPNADRTPLDCPDLEGRTPGEYTCTSTVDGQDVTWAMTVLELTAADGGDSTAVNLYPDYGSPAANAERALMRSFRNDYDQTLESVMCPPTSDATIYNGTCRGAIEGVTFDIPYESLDGTRFRYEPTGVGFKQSIENDIASGLEEASGLAASVSCEAPNVFEFEVNQEFVCDAQGTDSDNEATIRAVVLDQSGRFKWDVVSTGGGS